MTREMISTNEAKRKRMCPTVVVSEMLFVRQCEYMFVYICVYVVAIAHGNNPSQGVYQPWSNALSHAAARLLSSPAELHILKI